MIESHCFSRILIDWQRTEGRHDLPWQGTRDPYAIWVSEIMLQQTQVATVIPYYLRFSTQFPCIEALAAATEDDVLTLWSGLGYYSRARNLHRAAQRIMTQHAGEFPRDFEQIQTLPGIGRSTAAAIAAFAFGQRQAILDGNVKRVLARNFGIEGYPGDQSVGKTLWALAEQLLPSKHIERYTQGLMDLGASLCRRNRPHCSDCPLQSECIARRTGRTALLPTRKIRPPLPEKETAMLVLLCAGEILLEKRPPSGIWGGLWSLPEIAVYDDPAQAALTRFGVVAKTFIPLTPIRHTFTHFRLHIRPLVTENSAERNATRSPSVQWQTLPHALGMALPSPIRQLLKSMG